jgi:hypothetical protein
MSCATCMQFRPRGPAEVWFACARRRAEGRWTCKKGIGEDLENVGSTVAIMRIIDLLPG